MIFPLLCILGAVVICVIAFSVGWWIARRGNRFVETTAIIGGREFSTRRVYKGPRT